MKNIRIDERSEFGEANHKLHKGLSGSKLDQPDQDDFTNIDAHERSE